MKRFLTMGVLLLAGLGMAQTCGGLPRLSVMTAQGYCVGIVSDKLSFPRGVLGLENGDLLVVEMGGWNPNQGALTRLRKQGNRWVIQRIFTGLDRPNGLTLGPDGKVYVGEVGRIFRFDPAQPAKEYVIRDLPGKGRHPLTQMVFDTNGDLFVNVGSGSDNCQQDKGKAVCTEAQTQGLIRKYTFRGGKVTGWSVYAKGLRNSMALAVHPSGLIVQGENSRDAINAADPKLDDATLPHDELNVLARGAHYGWPYCYDNQVNAPEFPRFDCAHTQKPRVLLPAHAAPLGMTYWLTGPQAYRGWLVVGYHGYRPTGHRLVAFPVDARGIPSNRPIELIQNWVLPGGKLGAPVDVKPGPNGTLLITDDRNGMLLMFGSSGL